MSLLSGAVNVQAEDGVKPDIYVATWSSPAICCDAGQTVNLSLCSVQYAYLGDVIAGDKITWTNESGKKITSYKPAKAGVYTLKATSGKLWRTVYLVAKNPEDTEYVLYENDFSASPLEELRTVQRSTGAKIEYDSKQKALLLNASNSSSAYIRVALPEYLDCFGDAIFTANLKLDNQTSSTMWGSMMFRIQEKYYPYMQLCMRYNSTYSSGLEIAQRNESNAWNVVKTAGTAESLGGTFNDVTADFCGKTTNYIINGKTYLTYDSSWYTSGAMGFQVRGLTMTVKSVKVCVNPNSSATEVKYPGGYVDTRETETGLSQAASLISYVNTVDELNNIGEKSPTAAIFKIANDGGKLTVKLDSASLTVKEAAEALGDGIISGFEVEDTEAAEALAKYLKSRNMRDVYLVSSDASALTAARNIWAYPYGVLDMTGGIGDASAAAVKAAESNCRTVILNSSDCSRENVKYLLQRYLTVWTDAGSTASSVCSAINSGVTGLITSDRAFTEKCMYVYYTDSTITREVSIIAHRGLTWMHQENSIEGYKDAFEFGATALETDVQMTKDSVLIIMHDSTIDRTTNGKGYISDLTLEEIKQYKLVYNTSWDAEEIPTLEELLAEFADTDKQIVIEYKSSSIASAKPMAELIQKYGLEDRVCIISFYPAMLAAVKSYIPGIACAWLESAVAATDDDPLAAVVSVASTLQLNSQGLSPAYTYINLDFTKDFLARGFTSWIWTVNDLVLVDRYICQGYIGITTNHAEWITDYAKNITVSEIDGKFTVTETCFGGELNDVTADAEAVIVEDNGTGASWNPETGSFTAKNSGTADVFFRYTFTTTTKQQYTLVTDVLQVNISAEAETEAAGSEDTTEALPAETTADTPDETTVEDTYDETQALPEEKNSGCGKTVLTVVITVAVMAALNFAYIIIVRKGIIKKWLK